MNFFKISGIILQKIRVTRALNKLNIGEAGVEDQIPFVELSEGFRVFGLDTREKERKYYNLLCSSVKRKLPFECYKVAMDIYTRFVEGGLKLGGPGKEHFYQIKSGDTIAEMGAYMGYYTLYLSRMVGPDGIVVAIEPMPDNLKYLKRNIDYNGIKNVRVVEKGVWNKKEIQTFYQVESDTQSASLILEGKGKKEFSIEVNTLDEILKEQKVKHVDFMLIQLNGIEPEALEGLNEIKPENFAIAARYKSGKAEPVPKINSLLSERDYKVNIVKRDYVYAQKDGK